MDLRRLVTADALEIGRIGLSVDGPQKTGGRKSYGQLGGQDHQRENDSRAGVHDDGVDLGRVLRTRFPGSRIEKGEIERRERADYEQLAESQSEPNVKERRLSIEKKMKRKTGCRR